MFVNVGFGNFVNTEQMTAVCRPDSSPMKRMISEARSTGMAIDATQGRKTKSVITVDNGRIVLSALLPETIAARCNASYSSKISGMLQQMLPEEEQDE